MSISASACSRSVIAASLGVRQRPRRRARTPAACRSWQWSCPACWRCARQHGSGCNRNDGIGTSLLSSLYLVHAQALADRPGRAHGRYQTSPSTTPRRFPRRCAGQIRWPGRRLPTRGQSSRPQRCPDPGRILARCFRSAFLPDSARLPSSRWPAPDRHAQPVPTPPR